MTGKLLSNALVGALANRCCVQTEFFGRCVYLYNFVVASCTGASKVLTTIAIKMSSNVVVRKKIVEFLRFSSQVLIKATKPHGINTFNAPGIFTAAGVLQKF